MKKTQKALVLALCAVMLVAASVFGTLAYLTDKTEPIENVFTVGNVDIELAETEKDFHIVPGRVIAKDPTVTVEADSEDAYVFVKVEENNWLDKLTYEIADGWKELSGVTGVYYREYTGSDAATYPVLKNNQVVASTELTEAELGTITAGNEPTLTITAYAIQSEGFESAEDAWAAYNTQNP